MARRIALVLIVVLALAALLLSSQMRREPLRVSGFVEADEIRLGSRVGGRVSKVLIQEGDVVEAGQTLVELEPFDLIHRQAEARALLAEKQAELGRLEAGLRPEEISQAKARYDQIHARLQRLVAGPRPQEIEGARAQVQAALAQLELAQQSYRRSQELSLRNAATQAELDDAIEKLKEARNLRVVREKELELLEEGTRPEDIAEARAMLEEANQAWKLAESGYREEDIQQARAARDATQAQLGSIEQQLQELIITAPITGVIEAVELQKGDLVAANAPALSMIDTRNLWVRAYVPGRFNVQLNQKLTVTVDGLPDQDFAGYVSYRSRQAEFTPSNVQTPEERAKQVFRIKVVLEPPADNLWPGMTVDVWFE